jgi:hypothetical protein
MSTASCPIGRLPFPLSKRPTRRTKGGRRRFAIRADAALSVSSRRRRPERHRPVHIFGQPILLDRANSCSACFKATVTLVRYETCRAQFRSADPRQNKPAGERSLQPGISVTSYRSHMHRGNAFFKDVNRMLQEDELNLDNSLDLSEFTIKDDSMIMQPLRMLSPSDAGRRQHRQLFRIPVLSERRGCNHIDVCYCTSTSMTRT